MNKTVKYTTNGALLLGFGNALLNTFEQYEKIDSWEHFDWEELLQAFIKGALVGGAIGFAIGAVRDDEMTKILISTGGTIGFIEDALDKYSDNDIALPKKAQKIQAKLNDEFGEQLSEYPSINGSTKKGTSIQNSDIDIHIKFNKNAGSIENIRDEVEEYLTEQFTDKKLVEVRSQNHSIGLVFDIKSEERRIDVVPMREVENGKGDTFLYSTKQKSIKKTNAEKQTNKLIFTEKQKQIIKLLKCWKINNDLRLPSILIEHLVKIAFIQNEIPRGLDKSLLFIIKYIANNITRIKITDPANTNNIISDILSSDEKIELQNFCYTMLDEIEKDERNIIDYFSNN